MEPIKVENITNEIKSRNFFFNNELIFNYFNCLKTKPFLILTGISGSGKSKLSQVFADIISKGDKSKIELIPVKPNWKDSKGLFGYHNLLDNTYYVTPLIKLMIRALNDPENPYFLVLDEMNLAKTEHYFADYLSLIESRQLKVKNTTTNINNYNNLKENFNFKQGASLSEAIILAAIDFNTNRYLPVADYREHNFSKLWREQFSNVSNENWTPQFRTELNQGENRLANRVFESPNGEGRNYRLKDKSSLNSSDRAIIDRLEKTYTELINGESIEIYQDLITLHNNDMCIGVCSDLGCPITECSYNNEEKYKCDKLYNNSLDTYLVPPKMPIPLNLFTIGTVNIDETTYMFSPKVLDRANVIEFNDVDFENLLDLTGDFEEILRENSNNIWDEKFYFDDEMELQEFTIDIPNAEHAKRFMNIYADGFKDILTIFDILRGYNMHFGYRTMNEISLFICNVNKFTSFEDKLQIAVDLQILQKILPKFHGSYEKLWNPLFNILLVCMNEIPSDYKNKLNYTSSDIEKLLAFVSEEERHKRISLNKEVLKNKYKYPRSAKKILSMMKNLEMHGFSSYIE
ncbi:AAA family ATPase [Alkaliphilus transvaalensis]|uniref:AAA family ATPase n=1 Tax=Alkaliphilus transvaalensis TaxID=114628 RepID=UPI0004791170|nr:AAA family ATPase [Alkaliphilus transvaalensis]